MTYENYDSRFQYYICSSIMTRIICVLITQLSYHKGTVKNGNQKIVASV